MTVLLGEKDGCSGEMFRRWRCGQVELGVIPQKRVRPWRSALSASSRQPLLLQLQCTVLWKGAWPLPISSIFALNCAVQWQTDMKTYFYLGWGACVIGSDIVLTEMVSPTGRKNVFHSDSWFQVSNKREETLLLTAVESLWPCVAQPVIHFL